MVAGRPRGSLQAYRLDASAVGGAVDVLGVFDIGTSTNAATFHRRLLPGLTLTADPGRLRRVELRLPGRATKASATKSGYVKGALRLRAR